MIQSSGASPTDASPATSEVEPALQRFKHPKVICIDLPDDAVNAVRAAGYRVTEGTLGQPYEVPHSDDWIRPFIGVRLPGFTEQEVVVVQHALEPIPEPTGTPPRNTSEAALWSTCQYGHVDTRPWAARALFREHMDRILRHGGVVIFFCEPKRPSGLAWAERTPLDQLSVKENLDGWSIWDLLSALDYFTVKRDHGEEIEPVAGERFLAPLALHLESATFSCTIEPPSNVKRWRPLARNKYGASVAGVLLPQRDRFQGFIFLLPQVPDPGSTVHVLLDEVLPVLAPTLFPESERSAWRFEWPYELREAQDLKTEIERVRREAEARKAQLTGEIDSVRERDGWLHDLLTGTDRTLVEAVVRALRELGLSNVRPLDDEAEERGGDLREDIQVIGATEVMLVEVKGLTRMPKEADSLQVQKYVAPRMRELRRTDIRGLAVINHQRAIPPLQRQNERPFQEDVLYNAAQHDLGLLTAFDLFQLVVNKRALGWPVSVVAPLLYRNGRIGVVPTHYEYIGKIDNYYEQIGVAAILLAEDGFFSVGDRLAYALPVYFHEEDVSSIHFDDVPVQSASAGQHVGVKTGLSKAQARNGVRVYRLAAV